MNGTVGRTLTTTAKTMGPRMRLRSISMLGGSRRAVGDEMDVFSGKWARRMEGPRKTKGDVDASICSGQSF